MSEHQNQQLLVSYARQLRELSTKFDQLDETKKKLNVEWDELQKKFVDLMETNKLQKFSVKGVGTCFIATDLHVNVDDKDKLFTYLRSHEAGALIKETVNGSQLKSYVKELREEANVTPDGVSTYDTAEVRIRKA